MPCHRMVIAKSFCFQPNSTAFLGHFTCQYTVLQRVTIWLIGSSDCLPSWFPTFNFPTMQFLLNVYWQTVLNVYYFCWSKFVFFLFFWKAQKCTFCGPMKMTHLTWAKATLTCSANYCGHFASFLCWFSMRQTLWGHFVSFCLFWNQHVPKKT